MKKTFAVLAMALCLTMAFSSCDRIDVGNEDGEEAVADKDLPTGETLYWMSPENDNTVIYFLLTKLSDKVAEATGHPYKIAITFTASGEQKEAGYSANLDVDAKNGHFIPSGVISKNVEVTDLYIQDKQLRGTMSYQYGIRPKKTLTGFTAPVLSSVDLAKILEELKGLFGGDSD